MTTCLVTGGAGFVGSHLVDKLINDGNHVIVVDDLSFGSKLHVNPKALFIEGALENTSPDIFSNVDIVFHLAAAAGEAVSLYSPKIYFVKNLLAGYRVVENCLINSVKRLVFISSIAVYGNKRKPPFSEVQVPTPTDVYGVSKLALENLIQTYGATGKFEWSILRLYNLYGSRMNLSDPYRGVISIMINRLSKGKPPVIYGDGTQTRAYTYINDIIPLVAMAGFSETMKNEVFNLGSDEVTNLIELSDILSNLFEYDGSPIFMNLHSNETKHAHCSIEKAVEKLGNIKKTKLYEGLASTVEWCKSTNVPDFNYQLVDLQESLGLNIPDAWKYKTL